MRILYCNTKPTRRERQREKVRDGKMDDIKTDEPRGRTQLLDVEKQWKKERQNESEERDCVASGRHPLLLASTLFAFFSVQKSLGERKK